ncbi:GNAT family N-acetyltransferase [Paenibacillus caui]|uniref:GNAT family N-acetyltransferase n=1 Tax=Paenibacillus caui TaxID=2873927 RepID=UPI001CA875BB|nr:GNAT family N-acetyltransferase [Paenibacillus caui]
MSELVQSGSGFILQEDGRPVAEISYILDGDTMTIDHTFVSEELRGQKVGEQLVRKAVHYARENGLKIVPACSYALALFRRHKEYADVWKQ